MSFLCVERPNDGTVFTHWTDQDQMGPFLDNSATSVNTFNYFELRVQV